MAALKKAKTRPKAKRKNAQDAPMKIRGNLKLQYHAAVLEVKAAEAELKAQEATIKRRCEQDESFAEAISMMSHRTQIEKDLSKAFSNLYAVGRKVCVKLGIAFEDFGKYTVETESGNVVYMPQPPPSKAPPEGAEGAPDQENS